MTKTLSELVNLRNIIFYGLNDNEAQVFQGKFVEVLAINADLSQVIPQFMIWLLSDKKDGVIQYMKEGDKRAMKIVVGLYKKELEGLEVTNEERSKALAGSFHAFFVADAAKETHYKKIADKLIELIEGANWSN